MSTDYPHSSLCHPSATWRSADPQAPSDGKTVDLFLELRERAMRLGLHLDPMQNAHSYTFQVSEDSMAYQGVAGEMLADKGVLFEHASLAAIQDFVNGFSHAVERYDILQRAEIPFDLPCTDEEPSLGDDY